MQFVVSTAGSKGREYLAPEPLDHEGSLTKISADRVLVPVPEPACRFNALGAVGAALVLAARTLDPRVRIHKAPAVCTHGMK